MWEQYRHLFDSEDAFNEAVDNEIVLTAIAEANAALRSEDD